MVTVSPGVGCPPSLVSHVDMPTTPCGMPYVVTTPLTLEKSGAVLILGSSFPNRLYDGANRHRLSVIFGEGDGRRGATRRWEAAVVDPAGLEPYLAGTTFQDPLSLLVLLRWQFAHLTSHFSISASRRLTEYLFPAATPTQNFLLPRT